MKRNADIRKIIKEAGLFYWEVAEGLGLTDGNLSRLLRKELSETQTHKILDAIEALKKNEI